MEFLLLDTTVIIDVLRGRDRTRARVRQLLQRPDPVYVSAVTVEEVARGVRDGEVADARLLLSSFDVVPLGPDVAWTAGIWRRDLARTGVTIPQADCLIAATAHAAGARLATGNPRHFPMPELVVEHWPAGE